MRVNLVRIGNSQGIRIPKPLLAQCAFGEEAYLEVRNGSLVITPVPTARSGWEDAFKAGASDAEPLLLEGAPANDFDSEEWEW